MIAQKMETTIVYWGYIRIMEKKMETKIVYWGYIILGSLGFIVLAPLSQIRLGLAHPHGEEH